MAYHLLTGPTGLLGSYLLRDGLLAGRCLAVLVRRGRSESARSRVESMLARLEGGGHSPLPRPVVIEGDLSQPGLGVEASDVRWLTRHCTAVIHNAANLTFEGSPHGEPWLSNVHGTRELLGLCRLAGIRQFHHISTAYVCGQRQGRIRETELAEGQSFNNDYEQSKAEAETMLRSAAHLDSLTIYRPSIIVGDSVTGFTSAYHGIYLVLRLADTLARRVSLGSTAGELLVRALGMQGHECKNLVPVDWVSAAITALVGTRSRHGSTYHLVTRHPLPLCRIAQVFQTAVERYSLLAEESDVERLDGHWFASNFRQQMTLYQAYFRHDPAFDDTHTAAALPELPCPVLEDATLLRMAAFAIQANFGKPKPRPIVPEFDVADHLDELLQRGQSLASPARDHCLGLQVNGPGGGQWQLLLDRGRPVAAERGLGATCSATYVMDATTFRQLVLRQFPASHALATGRVLLEGSGRSRPEFAAILESVVIRPPLVCRSAG